MRTVGFLALTIFAVALYAAPGPTVQMLMEAAFLAKSGAGLSGEQLAHDEGGRADQGWSRSAKVIPTGQAREDVASKPWETVADVIADARLVKITKAEVRTDGDATLFNLAMSQGVTAEVFTLAEPYRVVIDMPEVAFKLPDGTGQGASGLIKAFRYGLFSADKGRVVIDTDGPVRIADARMQTTENGVTFEIRLLPISVAEFGSGTGANREPKAKQPENPQPQLSTINKTPAPTNKSQAKSAAKPAQPVIVIDPGHGGIDPGAVGVSNLLEKDVVLGVAKALRTQLKRAGAYDVYMTRDKDVFLPLQKRVSISRGYGADLFVSLHADSVSDINAATTIRGASVYTLSNRASDALARQMAEKENASDALAGISSDESERMSDVRSILADLIQRETANFSTEFSNVLLRQLRRDVSLTRGPRRSAAFTVLKQSHAPSVLIELGYMSNPGDERMMRTEAWRNRMAKSIAKAIKKYFEKRQARR